MALNPLPVQSPDRLLGPPPVHCFRITGDAEAPELLQVCRQFVRNRRNGLVSHQQCHIMAPTDGASLGHEIRSL
jgi:hypothetical protein